MLATVFIIQEIYSAGFPKLPRRSNDKSETVANWRGSYWCDVGDQ